MKNLTDYSMPSIFYIIGVNPKLQNVSAALNRVKSINRGFGLNNVQSEVILVNSKVYKSALYGKLKALLSVIFKFIKAKRGDTFIFYGRTPYYILLPLFKKKLRFVVELNEFPSYLIKDGGVSLRNKKKDERFLRNMKHFNGLITCSRALSTFYSPFLSNKDNILICPLIVDIDKFIPHNNIYDDKGNYFAYCGRLGNNKDGVPILIDSFTSFAKEVDSIKLYIIGNANENVENELKEKVSALGMTDRIVFTGALPHDELIPILQGATLLLLARPNNKQAEGGIPSKVGEYMAVKVPMVLTQVGELDSFLTDDFNCFMAEPDSVESFKLKMLEAYHSPKKGIIAHNAFQTVKQFDIKNQSRLISEFCMKL
jgi:glycosyltransferase involved in cell wall biosynthesis